MEINPNLSDKAKQDLELVMLAIKGNQKAYAELLSRYRDAIYFMLLKMVNNKFDAEDLTIEAFGKAFKIQSSNGKKVFSGCIGIGFERIVYTLYCQYGPRLEKWPKKLIKKLNL